MSHEVRARFGYDAREAAQRCVCDTSGDVPLTQQQFTHEVDVNTIVSRFAGGQLPMRGDRVPVYGDFSEVTDFDSALALVRQVQESFESLPATVRQRFRNDPGRLLAFAAEASDEELDELGIEVRPAPAAPVVPPVEPPPVVPPPAGSGSPQG